MKIDVCFVVISEFHEVFLYNFVADHFSIVVY